eukprot:TRINITY_DN15210_c0_g1_i1.p1 TRINITY_DN15210_c0_g1~~TRINITY_DN15210_c0_g1_i1.p1  ORF type:complete len:284 (-),score=44.28 TRINITY_DN15210_c0_g1_i1:473-1324(-)
MWWWKILRQFFNSIQEFFRKMAIRLGIIRAVQIQGNSQTVVTETGRGQVAQSLNVILNRINTASARVARTENQLPRLVAVSKTKPTSLIQEAYDAGHRCFGENYPQELMEKAPQLPQDIQWHFIGHLQSNKAKKLIEQVPNLAMIETIDNDKLAKKLDAAVLAAKREKLNVLIQVNTSGEDSKFGVEPNQSAAITKYIHENCSGLKVRGVMTIGRPDYTSRPEDFECLKQCRRSVADVLGVDEEELELSMGMSGDFESAIEMGSTNIRVGSSIFGARDYSNKQ